MQDKLQFELYTNVNRAEKLPELLGEPPHIMEERKQLTTQVGRGWLESLENRMVC